MLSNTDNNNISIKNYEKYYLTTFMLALWLFIIRKFTRVYLEVISIASIFMFYCIYDIQF